MSTETGALIVGAGSGLSASLARKFSNMGMKVVLASRNIEKLSDVVGQTGALLNRCDTSDEKDVEELFKFVESAVGVPTIVVFNAGFRVRGSVTEVDPTEVKKSILISAYGGFLVGQAASRLMLKAGQGTIFFTGASAAVKGYPMSAPFAMGKFGLRGLAQSMARELHPRNIHIVHVVIDGGIRSKLTGRIEGEDDDRDKWLDPDAIAETYCSLHAQNRSSWSWEIEVRPWVETF